MNKAFTLVELAIVLIIIGLITGGVVGAQSLIESGKRQSLIREFENIITSIRAFQLEYDSLPGDMADAYDYWGANCGSDISSNSTGGCNGDNNGRFDGIGEMFLSWQHLRLAEIMPDLKIQAGYTYPGGAASYTVGTSIPRSSYGNESAFMLLYWYPPFTQTTANHLQLIKPYNSGANHGADSIGSRDALRVDKKLDDGLPNSGLLRGDSGNGGSEGCSNSNEYLKNNTEENCVLRYIFNGL